MENFTFQNATKIIFGKGTEKQVGQETKLHSSKVLLHYGGGSIKKIGLYDQIVKSLKEANIDFVELGGVQPNPRLSLVHEGIRLCREHNLDFILAVGGGSVIDSAKAISVGVAYEGDVWDFYMRKAQIKEVLPIGVVLTIPAAGSETSGGSVVTKEEGGLKRDIGDERLRPQFAIMNPELTFSLPDYQTACGITDMMAHIMERYFTNVTHVDVTDHLCEGVLRAIINNAKILLDNPKDYNARAEIMWAGTLAHNDLLGTGRIGDWASHPIEHEISGIYDVAHGAGLAVVFPAWMKYVYKHNVERFAQFAVRVWNVEYNHEDPERTALEGIYQMTQFFKRIGMPVTLKELGIEDDRIEEMADKCTNSDTTTIGNFVKLNKQDIINIYNLAK